MTEKRFKFLDGYSLRYTCIIDRMKIEECDVHKILKQDELLDLLNDLNDENEQLKSEIKLLRQRETVSKVNEIENSTFETFLKKQRGDVE